MIIGFSPIWMSSLMALSIHWRTWKQKILGAEDLTINFQALEVTPFSPKVSYNMDSICSVVLFA